MGEGPCQAAPSPQSLKQVKSLMLEACYPLDYDKFTGENDEEWAVPPYPMEEWLTEAKTSCDRIYGERNAL